MGKARALVNKLKRRQKALRMDRNGFDRRDKQDQSEEVLAKTKGHKVMRGIQRRLDAKLGLDAVAHEPMLAKRLNMTAVERLDYDDPNGDFGIHVTLAAGVIAAVGIRPNDIIKFLEGELKGKELKVVAVTDATNLRLEDVATYVGPETNVVCRAQLSAVKKSYK